MPPGPRTSLDQGVHFLKLTVGPAYGLGMWRKEKLCTQWKRRVIPFAIGCNTLQQDTWAESGLSVYSVIILERGRARGLKLCNYQKKETTHHSSHLHRTAQLFLDFLILHWKRTFLLAESLLYVHVTLWCFQLYAREVIWYAVCMLTEPFHSHHSSFSPNRTFVWGEFL